MTVLRDDEPGFEGGHCEGSKRDGEMEILGLKLYGGTRKSPEHLGREFISYMENLKLSLSRERERELQERHSKGGTIAGCEAVSIPRQPPASRMRTSRGPSPLQR